MFKIMKTEIDFQSSTRFEMSTGIVLFTISILIFIYIFINSLELLLASYSPVILFLVISSFILFLMYFYFGLKLVKKGYNGLKKSEGLEKKYKFEHMFNQILEQDLKLIELKLKQLEYNEKVRSLNEKVRSLNEKGVENLKEMQYRDLKTTVAQALDPDYYENTYPEIVKNITKRQENINNENNKKIDSLDKEAKYNAVTNALNAFVEYAKKNNFIKYSIIRFPQLLLLSFAFTLSIVVTQKINININWIYYLVMFFFINFISFCTCDL